MSETQERVFFEHEGVKVTNVRFIVPSQTYAMSGITSVRFFTQKPSFLWPVLFFSIALLLLAGGKANVWTVGAPAMIGVLLLLLRRPVYHVVLSTASGETRAMNAKNKGFISSVIEALNQAIVARG